MFGNKIFGTSEKFRQEYCCTIVKVGELYPINGKDNIVSTMINGFSVVVRKDNVQEGDIMIYAANETRLNHKFLSANNLYECDSYEKNANCAEVGKLILDGILDVARSKCGFFKSNGRVRLIRLGGVPSYGYLFSINELAKAYPDVLSVDFNKLVGIDFDTVCGEEFVSVYVPEIKEATPRLNGEGKLQKRNRKLSRFTRLIPGKFSFHYDTQQLNRNMTKISPIDVLSISVKIHGASICIGNILTKKPNYGGLYDWLFPYLPKFMQFYHEDYDVVCSSRTIIKSRNINRKLGNGYYGINIYAEYAELLKDKIPQGMMIYGEIFGYLSGQNKMIQEGYDYGCPVGTNKLMIYRISTENEDGSKHEWNVSEVYNWTVNLVKKYPELKKYVHPIDILFHGKLVDLYPEVNILTHWHENILQAMKNDKKHFLMEKNEPLCKNKVPREGIVVRIDDDSVCEAFKLKCDKFMLYESEHLDDNGVDIEMEESYC